MLVGLKRYSLLLGLTILITLFLSFGQATAQAIPRIEVLSVTLDKESYQAGEDVSLHALVRNASPRETLEITILVDADWIEGQSVESSQVSMRAGDTRVISIIIPTKEDSIGPKVLSVGAFGTFVAEPDRDRIHEVHLALVVFPDQPQSLVFPLLLVAIIGGIAVVVIIGARGWSTA